MKVVSNIIRGMCITLVLVISYPQNVCITSAKTVDKSKSNMTVVERKINKDLSYFKENISFPVVKGESKSKNIQQINQVLYKDILLKAMSNENAAKEMFDINNKIKPTFPYEVVSKFETTKDDENILSFYNDFYEYLGGAHGNTVRTSYSINKKKQSILTLNELFSENYNYEDVINKVIAQKLDENPNNYFYNSSNYKGIDNNAGFYIKDNVLVIYYELYEIAPYVAGIPEFEIPIELFGSNYIYKDV